MFAGLINQAKSAASGLILKYVARASVAVPFVIAAGFALAAIAAMLVDRFGRVMAYWLVAAGLALIGVIASIVVSVKGYRGGGQRCPAQALVQTPIALLGALMTLPGGSAGALSAVRLLARNLPLVLQLVMIGMLFWPTKEGERLQDEHDALRTPNGPDDRPRAQHFATLMHDCRGGRGIVAPPETLGWAKATLLETSQGVAASGAPPILGHAARRNRLDRVKAPAVIPGKGERPGRAAAASSAGSFRKLKEKAERGALRWGLTSQLSALDARPAQERSPTRRVFLRCRRVEP